MARPSIEVTVREKVVAYMEGSAKGVDQKMSFSVASVAKAIGHDRRVLKKYGLDVLIAEMARTSRKVQKVKRDDTRKTEEERLQRGMAAVAKLTEQVNNLLARLALVEGNAKRLGIDPDELFKSLMPPDRSVSKIYGRS